MYEIFLSFADYRAYVFHTVQHIDAKNVHKTIFDTFEDDPSQQRLILTLFGVLLSEWKMILTRMRETPHIDVNSLVTSTWPTKNETALSALLYVCLGIRDNFPQFFANTKNHSLDAAMANLATKTAENPIVQPSWAGDNVLRLIFTESST